MFDPTNDIDHILHSEDEIKARITELAAQVTKDYADKDLTVISILKGAFVFMADFIKAIPLNVQLDFMSASSYGNSTETSGKLNIRMDIKNDIRGKDVLIIEDILDTGVTLSYVVEHIKNLGAKSVKICTLLNKPERRQKNICADYVGFDIGNEFVVGYGLDFAENYRNLPYIGVLKPECYSKLNK